MAKRQQLNNRINKEDMFKKIMPTASLRQKNQPVSKPASAAPVPDADEDDLLAGFSDDLIDQTVNAFGDDLLDQLPSQPRVFATPAAPTAPVPPPRRSLRPQNPQSAPRPAPAQPAPAFPQPQRQTAEMPTVQATETEAGEQPSAMMDAAPLGPLAAVPEMEQGIPEQPTEAPIPPPEYGPQDYGQSAGYAPSERMPQEYAPPSYMPPYDYTQPYPPQSSYSPPPYGAPPMYPYPPQPYPYPPAYPPPYQMQPDAGMVQQQQAPSPLEPSADAEMPRIEHTRNSTVVADSASVVTDTVIIAENNPSGDAKEPKTTESEPPAAPQRQPVPIDDDELGEQPPHVFQPEMEAPQDVTFVDFDGLPSLSESRGDVVNVKEQITVACLDEAIAKIHGCRCEKCRSDVAAFALNRLTPNYVLADELTDEVLSRRETVAEVVEMLFRAAFQVKTFPRH